jgi:hypothetical protein
VRETGTCAHVQLPAQRGPLNAAVDPPTSTVKLLLSDEEKSEPRVIGGHDHESVTEQY